MSNRTLELIVKKCGKNSKEARVASRKFKREKQEKEIDAIIFHLMQLNMNI